MKHDSIEESADAIRLHPDHIQEALTLLPLIRAGINCVKCQTRATRGVTVNGVVVAMCGDCAEHHALDVKLARLVEERNRDRRRRS